MKKVNEFEMRSLEAGAFGYFGRRIAARRTITGVTAAATLATGVYFGLSVAASIIFGMIPEIGSGKHYIILKPVGEWMQAEEAEKAMLEQVAGELKRVELTPY